MIESLQHLREPLWLYTALLPAVLLIVSFALRSYRSDRYADAHFRRWVTTSYSNRQKGRYRRILFTSIAWLAFSIALAGPRLPQQIPGSVTEEFQEVILVVDLSLSMSARDIAPDRIQRVKQELADLVARMQNTRLGIVVYAARPHVLSPLTYDKGVLRHYIRTLRTRLLPTEGSNTLDALAFAAQQFSSNTSVPRSIILISDGEFNQHAEQKRLQLSLLQARLKQAHIRLFALGAGTVQGSAIMATQSGWTDNNHQPIITKLHRDNLQQLAQAANGQYHDLSSNDEEWRRIYDLDIALQHVSLPGAQRHDLIVWHEYHTYFIYFAFICLIIGTLPTLTGPKRYSSSTPLVITFSTLIVIGTLVSSANQAQATETADSYEKGYSLLVRGELQQAKEIFASLPGYHARFAEASAAYRLKQYHLAAGLFTQATLDAETQQQRIDAIFNLANSYFKLKSYQHADALYKNVLQYQADHRGALVNLEYTRELLKTQQDTAKRTATRSGKGPTTADAPAEMDLSNTRVSLGESNNNTETPESESTTNSDSPSTSSDLSQSSPASEKIEQNIDLIWTYNINDLAVLKQKAPRIQVNEAVLWQRLFESEEDFAAPQEQPQHLPGVKPW